MEWITLAPPLIAIGLAVWTRDVVVALLGALLASEILLALDRPWAGVLGTPERIAQTLGDPGNARVLLFSLMVGGLVALVNRSGGVAASVDWIRRRAWGRSPRGAGLVTTATGSAVFIDTNLSLFTAALVGKPLFDRAGFSRARLAYLIDSTSAPISVLVLINGWGAYVLGLLQGYDLPAGPVVVLAATIPLNFYALTTVAGAYATAATGRVFGPLARVESTGGAGEVPADLAPATKARYFLVPLVVLIVAAPVLMTWTGGGNILRGSGSQAVLWSVSLALATIFLMSWRDRLARPGVLGQIAFDGSAALLRPVFVLLASMALGASLRELGTGDVIAAALSDTLPVFATPALVFVVAAAMSFTTGTSWGTYGIMFPLAMPLALSLGAPPSLVAAAVLGGGVFGDHCSPISDTTVIASLAAGCEHLEHVRTQLPYALAAGGVAIAAYLAAGLAAV